MTCLGLIIVGRERTMDMLQTSLRTADGARRFNVSHKNTFLVETSPTRDWDPRNHPRSALPPGTTPSKDCHIHLKQWRPSTRTVAETPRRHHAQITTQTMRNNLRRFTLRVRRPYRGPILNRQRRAARLHLVMVQRLSLLNLPHTGLP